MVLKRVNLESFSPAQGRALEGNSTGFVVESMSMYTSTLELVHTSVLN
jgi:hypothetical protein